MKKFVFLSILGFFISSISFAQMQLKLDLEKQGLYFIQGSASSLDAVLPAQIPPSDAMSLYKGMWMIGIMADVSFPFGDDFKHIAGTAFSAHAMAGYLVAQSFLLTLRAGYVKYATQTEEGSELGFNYKYEDTYSQIPVLLGAYYLFATAGNFKPYIGLALGVFFQTYKANWQETGDFGYNYSFDGSSSTTSFGIAPGLGAYLLLSGVILSIMVEYNYLFTEPKNPEGDTNYTYNLGKPSGFNEISQDATTDNSSSKPSSLSVSLGVSFPIGK